MIVCDLRALATADVGSIEAIARLQLIARRLGGQVRVRRASDDVRELIDLIGLSEILTPSGIGADETHVCLRWYAP